MLFDTEFLICLQGGAGIPRRQRAVAFLESTRAPLYISRVCWMEFAEACSNLASARRELEDFAIVEVDEAIAWEASRIARVLKGSGQHIGDNDIWIAATAKAHGLPLVSNNVRHLGRVPGLDLRVY
jgi:predicted nucleic acid-binding protein